MSSSPLAMSLPHAHPLCLFVVVVSSLCPLLSLPVPSRRHATSLRCHISRRPSRLIVVESLRPRVLRSSNPRVLSRLVVVSRPLTHLVTSALFDCCVVALHLVVMACLSQRVNLPSRRTMSTLTPSLLIFRRCRRGPAPPLPSVAAQHTSPNAIAPLTCRVIVMLTQH